MTFLFSSVSILRRCVFLCGAGLAASLTLHANPAFPAKVTGTSKDAADLTKTAKPEETIFFTTRAGRRRVLGRSNATGTCKAYLGRFGRGWQNYPDSKVEGDDFFAASSPDGSQFALLTNRGGSVNLWLISADGRKVEALTDDDAGIIAPDKVAKNSVAFSPDGKNIAYIARNELWVLELDNRQARTLTEDGGIRALTWAPTGESLAVIENANLRRVELNGENNRTLVADGCDQPDLAWSANPSTPNNIYYLGRGAVQLDEQLKKTLLLPSTVLPNSLALLPSGLALLAPSVAGLSEVFLASFNVKDPMTQITQGGATAVWAATGGKAIYFLREQVLWRCNLDGSKAAPLGAVPMYNVNIGFLTPLQGGCQ